jgi:DNA topoisomerase VI subunit B
MTTATAVARTAFSTSRLLDFVSEKELTLQCGYAPCDWPLVIVKELVDNALDACEEQGIAPAIAVTVDDDTITVADNGAGIPPDTVDRMLDFSIRVSSREAYVAPDRGAQGNALKTIVAMPFVLDGDEGRVDICGAGTLSEITLRVDRIAQRPTAEVERTVKSGSFVRVHWPAEASSEDEYHDPPILTERHDAVRDLIDGFAFLNPHATLTFNGDALAATEPEWRKWTPSSPTSPHWYRPEDLERLIGAYVTHDQRDGHERTVRDFVAEFKGLTATAKRKAVLADVDLARAPLASLVAGRDLDHELVARLLAAMKAHTKPVKPQQLGVIGRDHLEHRFGALGIRDGSFDYKKVASLSDDGLPQVTEVAFAALENTDSGRILFSGVNWSAAWVNPFRQLGEYGHSLDSLMTERRFSSRQPIVLLVHVAHPRVQYADRGKSTVVSS